MADDKIKHSPTKVKLNSDKYKTSGRYQKNKTVSELSKAFWGSPDDADKGLFGGLKKAATRVGAGVTEYAAESAIDYVNRRKDNHALDQEYYDLFSACLDEGKLSYSDYIKLSNFVEKQDLESNASYDARKKQRREILKTAFKTAKNDITPDISKDDIKKGAVNLARGTVDFVKNNQLFNTVLPGQEIVTTAENAVLAAKVVGGATIGTARYLLDEKFRNKQNEKVASFINNTVPGAIKSGVRSIGNYIADNTYRPVIDTIGATVDAGKELIGKGKDAIHSIKQFGQRAGKAINGAKNAIKTGAGAIGSAAKKGFNAGKRAAKFVKNNGLKGTAQAAKNNISNRINKFNNSVKALPNRLKNRGKEFAINSWDSLKKNARLAAIRKYEEGKSKLVDFLSTHARTIKIIMAGSAGVIALFFILQLVLGGKGILTLIGPTPHYYCDSEQTPTAIKNRNAYRKYCKVGATNDGIVDAALSLIDPEYLVGNPNIQNISTTYSPDYGITPAYHTVMDELQHYVQYTQGAYPMPYANCIGFATTVMAYAGVPEDQIPKGNASSADEQLEGFADWQQVEFSGAASDYESLEPGTILVGNAGDGHIYVYIGTEAMQERFPQLPADYILAEAVASTVGKDYGGCASNRQDTWERIEQPITAWVFTGTLEPRDVPGVE